MTGAFMCLRGQACSQRGCVVSCQLGRFCGRMGRFLRQYRGMERFADCPPVVPRTIRQLPLLPTQPPPRAAAEVVIW